MNYNMPLYDNPSTRCPIVLLLDASGSMGEIISDDYQLTGRIFHEDGKQWQEAIGGTTRMDAVNRGLNQFFEEISGDPCARYSVEVKVISFGDKVKHETDFITFEDITSFKKPELKASGLTAMGKALDEGLKALEKRKIFYKKNGISYYQPWMLLMTDGAPTDHWKAASAKARALADSQKLNFFGVGTGRSFDKKTLSKILPANRPPLELDQTKFSEFFKWLSASMYNVSRSNSGQNVNLPPVDGWAAISV